MADARTRAGAIGGSATVHPAPPSRHHPATARQPPPGSDAPRRACGVALGIAALPFGLVYGVAVTESSVTGWLGVAASWIILAGAAQLSLLSLIDQNAAWPLAVSTALLINARFVLYSTALATAFRAFPTRWRLGLPYLLTDQAASLALIRFDTEHDPTRRRSFFLGAGLVFATGWWAGTVVGALTGDLLPSELDIDFAVPAMFIACSYRPWSIDPPLSQWPPPASSPLQPQDCRADST